MSVERTSHEVVVVGGGPAGAMAACLLAQAGRAVLLIEREAEARHKICGEFLSIEAQAALADLGIDIRALGGTLISRVRLVHGSDVAGVPLPFEGIGLTRRSLDEALLGKAEELGVTVRRGETVREVRAGEGNRLVLSGGRILEAPTVFLATGKHDVRGAKRREDGTTADLIGFKMYFRLAAAEQAALANHIEVILFKGGYAGLQLVEGGMANLCLLTRRDRFDRVGKSWDVFLAHLRAENPHLHRRLSGSTPLLDRPLAISRIPYGFIYAPEPGEPRNLYRLGDQAGVIPSFAGDGIAIALHTASLAAATYLADGDASSFHWRARGDIRGQIRVATWLYGIAQHHLGRSLLMRTCQTWPSAMQFFARWTRVSECARGDANRLLQRELPTSVGSVPTH